MEKITIINDIFYECNVRNQKCNTVEKFLEQYHIHGAENAKYYKSELEQLGYTFIGSTYSKTQKLVSFIKD